MAVLAWAVYRLLPYALTALTSELSLWQWSVVVLWTVFMVVSEGYDGFQKRLVPRVLTRATQLARQGDWVEIVLAPLYCFGYIRAWRRQLLVSYGVVAAIVVAVVVVHQLPQPYRGMVDIGVVAGLNYGVVALLVCALRVMPAILKTEELHD